MRPNDKDSGDTKTKYIQQSSPHSVHNTARIDTDNIAADDAAIFPPPLVVADGAAAPEDPAEAPRDPAAVPEGGPPEVLRVPDAEAEAAGAAEVDCAAEPAAEAGADDPGGSAARVTAIAATVSVNVSVPVTVAVPDTRGPTITQVATASAPHAQLSVTAPIDGSDSYTTASDAPSATVAAARA